MTELQKAEYDILSQTISICNALVLTYYLVCGTALGAVKYNGFIPWDDDVDIALCRNDYNIFVEKAQALLPSNMFVQTVDTDLYFPQMFCKIRNSSTTFIENSLEHLNVNHGVYIDVFPLDGYPSDFNMQRRLDKKKKLLRLKILCAYKLNDSVKKTTKAFVKLERLFGFHKRTADYVKQLTKELSSYSTDNSDIWCNHGNWQGKLEYAPKSQYGDGTWATFEGLKVRIPEKYDEYLTQKYGDWRADLPPEQQVGHHYAEIIDLNRPYTDYIVPLKHGKIRLKTSAELLKDGITPPENYKY